MSGTDQATHRLHAIVRTLLSPATWFVMALQYQQQLLLLLSGNTGEQGVSSVFLLAMPILMLLSIYFTAGLSQTFAHGRGVVRIDVLWSAARPVFGFFLVLCLKIILLVLLLQLFILQLLGYPGASVEQNAAILVQMMSASKLLLAGLQLFLVYWMPVVFVTRNFSLFDTMFTALRWIVRRQQQLFFFALLLLPPAILQWLLPQQTPMPVIVVLQVCELLVGWIAYVYCVEDINRHQALLTESQPPSASNKG